MRARFKREAQLAAQLLHPNIVTIFDIGEDDGRLYIVMELLRGSTLNEYLEQPAAGAIETKLELMTHVCEALALASGRGIYHRDIKPGNLFVTR